MIYDADGSVVMLGQDKRKARKSHRCSECRRSIQPGEEYMDERFIWQGEINQHRTCRHCLVVRDWLLAECGGYLYGYVYEDIREHVHEGAYGVDVKFLSIGMERRWQRRDGRVWPTPRTPKTTHEATA
ncbi:hypothetical protein CAI21_22320 [Alkalilimnicola ehrlichii]|nr:hypothetical protein [Alkalilimnicola ehrlichii]RFA24271.1 hypothetical protein CAI21_22320 [Alkalilimnicola ehrlichii]